MGISVTAEDVMILAAAVEHAIGERPTLCGHHGRHSVKTSASLGYLGSNPGIVVFELAHILAEAAREAARRTGYEYGADDMVDEIRNFIYQIGSAETEAVGRELLFYWPTIQWRSKT